jgi:hypothetical protein
MGKNPQSTVNFSGSKIAGGKFNEKTHKQKADMSSSRGFDDCARFPLGDLRRGLGYKI